PLVLRAEPVPEVEPDALRRELHRARAAEVGQHRLEGLLLGDPRVERLLAAEARRDLQRLAPVLPQARERVDEEVAVGDRLTDRERGVPGREHRQVGLVEVGDRLGVVRLEVAIGDLVDPGPHELANELAPGLAPDRLGDDADRVLGFDEAEGHRSSLTLVDRRLRGLYVGRWTAKRRGRRPAGARRRRRTRSSAVRLEPELRRAGRRAPSGPPPRCAPPPPAPPRPPRPRGRSPSAPPPRGARAPPRPARSAAPQTARR